MTFSPASLEPVAPQPDSADAPDALDSTGVVSMAHELRQSLTAIRSNAEVALAWLAADPPNPERAMRAMRRVLSTTAAAPQTS